MRLFAVLLCIPLLLLVGVMVAVPGFLGVFLALITIVVYFAFMVVRASDWHSIF